MDKVGVIGCGLMGSGIAEVAARSGLDVVVVERDADALRRGEERVAASLEKAASAGKLGDLDASTVLSRVTFTLDYVALADLSFVIEAVAEVEDLKLDVFRRLDAVVADPHAILASNTSSIPVATLASATSRRSSLAGASTIQSALCSPARCQTF